MAQRQCLLCGSELDWALVMTRPCAVFRCSRFDATKPPLNVLMSPLDATGLRLDRHDHQMIREIASDIQLAMYGRRVPKR